MRGELDEKSRRTRNNNLDSIPYQRAAEGLAKGDVRRFVRPHQVVGLGSGPMAASIIREMANLGDKETLKCIPYDSSVDNKAVII